MYYIAVCILKYGLLAPVVYFPALFHFALKPSNEVKKTPSISYKMALEYD